MVRLQEQNQTGWITTPRRCINSTWKIQKRNYHWVISMILSVRQVIIFMIVVIQNEYNWDALSSCVTVIIRINLLSNKFYHSNWLSIYVYTVYRINVLFQYKCMKTNLDCFCGEATSWVFHFIRAQLHTVSILVVPVVNSRLRMRKTSQRRGGGGDFRLDLDREVEHWSIKRVI